MYQLHTIIDKEKATQFVAESGYTGYVHPRDMLKCHLIHTDLVPDDLISEIRDFIKLRLVQL